MRSSIRIHSWTFVISVASYRYSVDCRLWSIFYAEDTYLLFLHKGLEQLKEALNINFSNICDWFVDNKLSIDFEEEKTKSILFSIINRKRKIVTSNIQYGDVKIKQYSKVTYLGFELVSKWFYLSAKEVVRRLLYLTY